MIFQKAVSLQLFIALVLYFPVFSQAQTAISRISAHVHTRQAEKGYASSIEGDLYYTADGNLVSHFTFPKSYFMITNNKGEVQIYNKDDNTVLLLQNGLFSTHSMPFYYFFSGETGDMGLKQAGYKIVKTNFDKDMIVTLWERVNSTPDNPIAFVKLVHKGRRPIYMDYEDKNYAIIRKTYYYDYTALNGTDFPKSFTEILYQDKDSVITKTEYSSFKINGQAASPLFEFKVPDDAKLVKQ